MQFTDVMHSLVKTFGTDLGFEVRKFTPSDEHIRYSYFLQRVNYVFPTNQGVICSLSRASRIYNFVFFGPFVKRFHPRLDKGILGLFGWQQLVVFRFHRTKYWVTFSDTTSHQRWLAGALFDCLSSRPVRTVLVPVGRNFYFLFDRYIPVFFGVSFTGDGTHFEFYRDSFRVDRESLFLRVPGDGSVKLLEYSHVWKRWVFP